MYTTRSEEEHIAELNEGIDMEDSYYIQPLPLDTIIPHCAPVLCPELNHELMALLDNAIKDRLSQEEEPPYGPRGAEGGPIDDYDGSYKYASIWDMKTCGLVHFTRETLGGFIGCDIPVEKWNLLGTIAADPLWASPGILSSCKLSFEKLSTFIAAICGRYVNIDAWMNYKNMQHPLDVVQMCLETIEKKIERMTDGYVHPITLTSTFITRDRLQTLMGVIPLTVLPWRVFADIAANGMTPGKDEWVTNDTFPSYNELNAFLCGIGKSPIPLSEWEQLKVACDLEFAELYIDDNDNDNEDNDDEGNEENGNA
jgi:hypothetical protein